MPTENDLRDLFADRYSERLDKLLEELDADNLPALIVVQTCWSEKGTYYETRVSRGADPDLPFGTCLDFLTLVNQAWNELSTNPILKAALQLLASAAVDICAEQKEAAADAKR